MGMKKQLSVRNKMRLTNGTMAVACIINGIGHILQASGGFWKPFSLLCILLLSVSIFFNLTRKKEKDDELSFANRSFAGEMAFLILTTLVLLSILIYDFVGDHVAWGLDSLIWISVGWGELVYVTVFELVETNKISSPHGG